MKNHGKIDPAKVLSPGTRQALLIAAQYLRDEPGLIAAQVTFDRDCLQGSDVPPTVHVIVDPDPAVNWAEHWGVD